MARGFSFHTRIVTILKVGLPLAAAALLLSVFIFRPEERRGGEIVFTEADLDRLGQGLRITNPTFTGTTASGDRFRFTADSVEPDAAPPTRAAITRLAGEIDFQSGQRMEISADAGELDIPTQRLDLAGDVVVQTSENYDLRAERLSIDLAAGVINGDGSVQSEGPLGSIDAGTLRIAPAATAGQEGAGRNDRRFSFGNGVRVIYDPPRAQDEPTEPPR